MLLAPKCHLLLLNVISKPVLTLILFGLLLKGLTIKKATKDDQGLYECKVVDHSGNTKTKTEFIRVLEQEETYIRIYFEAYQTLDITLGLDEKPVQWVVQIEAHPQPTIEW